MSRWAPALLLLAVAALCGARLSAERRRLGLAQAPALDALRPGQVAGSVLLGGFRGLYVDSLWYRAEGRFMEPENPLYEIPVLYELIGQLQPHYPAMWYYTAMRMAFDAPHQVPFPSADSDVAWVLRGLEHLERGLALNAAHPEASKLRFYLAEILHRRCTPNRDSRHGAEIRARLRARGRDPYEEAVRLVHALRRDPEALPAWLAKAAHVRFAAAIAAATPQEEDLHLASAQEEWDWICRLYRDPAPANRYVREAPERYRSQLPFLKENFQDILDLQRRALRLEAAGRTEEALAIWIPVMRRALLNTGRPEPMAEKHLRRSGRLAGVYEALAGELDASPPAAEPEQRARREALATALRRAAARERGGA